MLRPACRPPAWLVAGLVALPALLAGCATAPREATPPAAAGLPGTAGPLIGRLAVQVEGEPGRSFAADFELEGTATQGTLVLSGPLGATAARARWSPGEAVLVGPQGETRQPDLDSLAREAFGEPLPMAALFDWLRGRPWPAAAAGPRSDGGPGFEQLGWQVLLDRLAEGRIEARRPGPPPVTVRVRLQAPG